MHLELGSAVIELRRRQEWSQTELARAIDKQGHSRRATDYMTIGRWERGIDSPCVRYSGMAHFDTLIWPTWILIFCLILPGVWFCLSGGSEAWRPVRGAV